MAIRKLLLDSPPSLKKMKEQFGDGTSQELPRASTEALRIVCKTVIRLNDFSMIGLRMNVVNELNWPWLACGIDFESSRGIEMTHGPER